VEKEKAKGEKAKGEKVIEENQENVKDNILEV